MLVSTRITQKACLDTHSWTPFLSLGLSRAEVGGRMFGTSEFPGDTEAAGPGSHFERSSLGKEGSFAGRKPRRTLSLINKSETRF